MAVEKSGEKPRLSTPRDTDSTSPSETKPATGTAQPGGPIDAPESGRGTSGDAFAGGEPNPQRLVSDRSSNSDSLSGAFTLSLSPDLGFLPNLTLGSTRLTNPSLVGSGSAISTGLVGGGPFLGSPVATRITAAERIDFEAFRVVHADNPIMTRPIVRNADHYRPALEQSWADLARDVYGPQIGLNASPEVLLLLGQALAEVNGRSNLGGLPAAVAVPDLRDMNRFLIGLKRDLRDGPPIERPAVARFGGDDPIASDLPAAGHRYHTRWNDRLRDVALWAYAGELRDLNPEEADAKLQRIMLVVARSNDLRTTDLRHAGVIWIPTAAQMEHALRGLAEADFFAVTQRRFPQLWASIRRTGRFAYPDLERLEDQKPIPATSIHDLAPQIDATDSAVRLARFDRAMSGPLGFNLWGIFSWNYLWEFYEESPPSGDDLPIRRDEEIFADYLDRVAPDLPAEEYRRILANPGAFMMRAAGLINANGDIDAQRRRDFTAAMQTLGLVDENGVWQKVDPEPGETAQQYADRIALEAARRAGLELEPREGESLETVYNRIRATATPRDRALLRQLMIWNQLVVLGADASGRAYPEAESPSTGLRTGPSARPRDRRDLFSLFGHDMVDLFHFGGYMPPPLAIKDADSKELKDLIAAWEEASYFDEAYDGYLDAAEKQADISDELESELERVTARAAARRRDTESGLPSHEEMTAARRAAQSADRVLAKEREYVERVVEKRTDDNIEINQTLARGEKVGGPGRRRRGS